MVLFPGLKYSYFQERFHHAFRSWNYWLYCLRYHPWFLQYKYQCCWFLDNDEVDLIGDLDTCNNWDLIENRSTHDLSRSDYFVSSANCQDIPWDTSKSDWFIASQVPENYCRHITRWPTSGKIIAKKYFEKQYLRIVIVELAAVSKHQVAVQCWS